jgi:hypothetical protein
MFSHETSMRDGIKDWFLSCLTTLHHLQKLYNTEW